MTDVRRAVVSDNPLTMTSPPAFSSARAHVPIPPLPTEVPEPSNAFSVTFVS